MKKIILVLIGIVLISSLIFASRAMSWRGGAGWGCGIGQGIGWSSCIQDRTEAQISQRPYGFDLNANLNTPERREQWKRKS